MKHFENKAVRFEIPPGWEDGSAIRFEGPRRGAPIGPSVTFTRVDSRSSAMTYALEQIVKLTPNLPGVTLSSVRSTSLAGLEACELDMDWETPDGPVTQRRTFFRLEKKMWTMTASSFRGTFEQNAPIFAKIASSVLLAGQAGNANANAKPTATTPAATPIARPSTPPKPFLPEARLPFARELVAIAAEPPMLAPMRPSTPPAPSRPPPPPSILARPLGRASFPAPRAPSIPPEPAPPVRTRPAKPALPPTSSDETTATIARPVPARPLPPSKSPFTPPKPAAEPASPTTEAPPWDDTKRMKARPRPPTSHSAEKTTVLPLPLPVKLPAKPASEPPRPSTAPPAPRSEPRSERLPFSREP